MVHSDRGIQYASKEFVDELKARGCIQSMSRKANCLDNAVGESFFATLKTEAADHKFGTLEEARLCIFEYLTVFYNQHRLHSYLNYLSPIQFETSQRVA